MNHDPAATVRSRPLIAVGLMSGTSLDGIDAALVETDGIAVTTHGPALTVPYPQGFRARLRACLGRRPSADDEPLIAELTDRHAEAVVELLAGNGMAMEKVDLIGLHGQTVLHRPERSETFQIGDPQRLADRLGLPVVGDFRSADVAGGGQGAPFVPLYHRALAAPLDGPLCVLNLGGVGNVTYVGAGAGDDRALLAFDTGPANAPIDDWVRATTGADCDAQGRLAAAGRIAPRPIETWLRHPYFRRPPPKSLDRDAFAFVLDDLRALSPEDGAATLTAFAARAVAAGRAFLPTAAERWLVTGGGRHNPTLLSAIAAAIDAPAEPVEAVGWRGDFLEAEAFAFLAVRSIRGLALSLPTTTGVGAPCPGGRLRRPARR